MRKTRVVAMALTFLLVLMYAINSYAVVSELIIQGEQKIKEGEKTQLEAIYNSYNDDNLAEKVEDNKNVTKKALWLSSDETVATVDDNGVVTGVAKGIVKITADYEIPAIHELYVLGEDGEEPVMVPPPEDEENSVVETRIQNTTVTSNTTNNTTNTIAKSNNRTTQDYLLWFILILCGILLVSLIISAIIKTFKKDDDDDDELKL